jgi:hypothetical protein
VERLMQDVKSRMGRRVCRQPEKVMVNSILLEARLRDERTLHPELEDVLKRESRRNRREEFYDKEDDDDACMMLGRGKEIKASMHGELASAAWDAIKGERESERRGWNQVKIGEAINHKRSLVFTRAECNEERVFSDAYERTRTRANYWVLIMYGQPVVPYVCRVKYFVKLVHPDAGLPPLRYAVADMHTAVLRDRMYKVNMANRGQGSFWERYGVRGSNIERKLCCAWPDGYGSGEMFFMTYNNITDR